MSTANAELDAPTGAGSCDDPAQRLIFQTSNPNPERLAINCPRGQLLPERVPTADNPGCCQKRSTSSPQLPNPIAYRLDLPLCAVEATTASTPAILICLLVVLFPSRLPAGCLAN